MLYKHNSFKAILKPILEQPVTHSPYLSQSGHTCEVHAKPNLTLTILALIMNGHSQKWSFPGNLFRLQGT